MKVVKHSLLAMAVTVACGAQAAPTNVYWGDTHLHTSMSGDAFLMGTKSLSPDDAYRYAKGYPVINDKTRAKMRINKPLDFLVVADHAEYMGVIGNLFTGDPELAETETGKKLLGYVAEGQNRRAFLELVKSVNDNKPIEDINSPEIRKTNWDVIVDSAEKHNDPGKFTAFIGWEWSSLPDASNLHRIVFMKEGKDVADKMLPFSAFDSEAPEDLWNWLDNTEKKTGANFVAIPHNGNVSKGLMFNDVDSNGKPLTADYAKSRQRWEPIYEVTQIKGDGETLAALSPEDEFAEFETYAHALDGAAGNDAAPLKPDVRDYARSALMRGLEYDVKLGVNPFKFGMIGSTDGHSGVSGIEEENFAGKFPIDSYPEGKKNFIAPSSTGNDMSASGLAAVWATENSREALFDAFRRKEVYASTGPRIAVRFFAGWDFNASDSQSADLADIGYAKGVTMGSDLTNAPKGKALSLLISAVKDPDSAHLDRIQVVKGWLDNNGKSHEKVYNVAAADNRVIKSNQLKPVGNTVHVESARYTNTIGDASLATVWTDPDFDPSVEAFYYTRVLEIPTPRHSTIAAAALKIAPPEGHAVTIQERAYSSPIWYTPAK